MGSLGFFRSATACLLLALFTKLAASDTPVPRRPDSPGVVNPVFRSTLRPWLSLDGEWEFAVDPDEVGEREQWFEGHKSFPGKIYVPGTWEAQSVGEPGPSQPTPPERFALPLRHKYVGSGWYRKLFLMPSGWRGKLIWLKVGGVNSQGWFWINGQFVGHLNAYCGTYKFDVTHFLEEGENTVVARVSNKVTSRKGLLNWLDQFGGFYRSIELESTASPQIDDLFVQSDFDNKGAVFTVQLSNPGNPPRPGHFLLLIKVFTLDGHLAGRGEVSIAEISDTGTEVSLPIALDPFRPWSPEEPSLFRADALLLRDDQAIDGWVERFGVRKLERRGADIYLNGRRYFLRGFGDDYVYPLTISSPPSREEHKKHLQLARAYGFNYVRHHTHVESPEYFEAAEEVGILIQPELPYYGSLPSSYASYMPLTDLNELIHHYRRYTALATYCMGNEGLHREEMRESLFRFAKLLDPERLVLHQDGLNTNYERIADFRNGPVNIPVGEEDARGGLPVVLHEYLNLAGPIDPRLEPLYAGAMAPPFSLQKEKELAEKIGVSWTLAERCIEGGHELQSIYQKMGLENARSVPELDGYDYWTIVDVHPLMPQGLLDMFWRPKRSSPEYFQQFNGEIVLLLPDLSPRGLDRNIVSGAKVSHRIACSNFSAHGVSEGRILWSVLVAGKKISDGRLEAPVIPQGSVSQLGQIEFAMPTGDRPVEVRLRAEIEGKGVWNEWRFYCFPDHWPRAKLWHPSGSEHVCEKLKPLFPSLQCSSSKTPESKLGRRDLFVTEHLDRYALNFLESGGIVLLLSLADFPTQQPGMQLGWWKPNYQRGTAMASSPAFGEFPTDGGLPSFAVFRIFRDATLIKGSLENRVEPLMVTMGKDGYLMSVFQSQVGAGRLFAVGLDLLSDMPEGNYLLDQFLKYLYSDRFEPRKQLPLSELRLILASSGGS